MSFLLTLIRCANNENMVLGSSFMVGFSSHLPKSKEDLEKPLRTITSSYISGVFTFIGGCVLKILVPSKLHFVITFTNMAACIYLPYKNLMEPESKHFHSKVDNQY